MALTFDIGDPDRPKGHAIVYFQSPTTSEVLATYVLILPIPMDIGKYLPPLLASQLGGMAGELMGEGMGSFAAPPVPESVESVDFLRNLASLRGDDLLSGGSVVLGDATAAMAEAAEAVQEYQRLDRRYADSAGPAPEAPPLPPRRAGHGALRALAGALRRARDRVPGLGRHRGRGWRRCL